MIEGGAAAPYGRALKMLLSENGFAFLGVVKVEGKTRKFWSQDPALFQSPDGKTDPSKVRAWLAGEDIDDDPI